MLTTLQPVLLIVGVLYATFGCFMLVPAIYDVAVGNPDWLGFAASGLCTLFVGIGLAIANSNAPRRLTIRQAFLMTNLAWLGAAGFGALPMYWSNLNISYTDAFFEAMSAITTTGATIIVDLDTTSASVKLWRGILQWIGGLGLIAIAIAVLPLLQVGGMQMFKAEARDTAGKILPRASQIAGGLLAVYGIATVVCAFCYGLAGMTPFDAIIHAMTTLATGGMANYDSSIGFYDSISIEIICIIFMLIGASPFVLFIPLLRGNARPLLSDTQIRWMLVIVAVATFLAWHAQAGVGQAIDFRQLVDVLFNVVSVITTTGYVTVDFSAWGVFADAIFFTLLFMGGCSASTSGGIKVFRFQIMYHTISTKLWAVTHPNAIHQATLNGRPITDDVMQAVAVFFFVVFMSFVVITGILGLYGLDLLTAMSATASALGNVGPGLGPVVGPCCTWAPLPDGAKWWLAVAMLLGRLEYFVVLVLLLPAFWRD